MADLGARMEATFPNEMVDDEGAFDKSILKSNLKRKMLNISEKLKLINLIETSRQKKKDIAASFGIPVNTLSSIYANRERILEQCKGDFRNLNMKKIRASSYPDVEEALLSWYIKNYASTPNSHISCLALRMKALQLAKSFGHDNFSASNGWIERFKMRHNLKTKKYKKKNSSPTCTTTEISFDISKSDNSINSSEVQSECQVNELPQESNPVIVSNPDFNYLEDEQDTVSYKLEPQDSIYSNGNDGDYSSNQLPSHAIPEVHLTEIDTNDQNYSMKYSHYNVDNESNQSKLSNGVQNVDEAFNVILHFIGNCAESISEKTLEAVKELKCFIEAEKERRKQSKITDYFKLI